MKKYFSMILAAFLATSCMDMELLPNDKTVDEDFWQSKSDVALMVNGAYKQFASAAVQQRLIIWGAFRSDELLLNTGVPSNDGTFIALNQIQEVNIETTNTYSDWSSLYAVINYCNIVMAKAEGVMAIDPSYTQGDYLTDRSQMLALRALCYFYLVRTFRDVPYTTTAYMTESQSRVIEQLPPTEVLQHCIDDLLEAEKNALSPMVTGWKRVGLLTKDGIQSILADIYLWRASVLHSDADYQACINYCDKVIASKKAQNQQGNGVISKLDYPLVENTDGARNAFTDLYVTQNSDESIFETQYNSDASGTNTGLAQMYYEYKKNGSSPYLMAAMKFGSSITKSSLGDPLDQIYVNDCDRRYWNNCIGVTGDGEMFGIAKYRSLGTVYDGGTPPTKPASMYYLRDFEHYNQNFIIYRLPDIMLMKAEAMVAQIRLAGDVIAPEDTRMADARELVNQVYKRSLDESQWASMLYPQSYESDPDALERLILQERFRELCFEGKRWFDILRYNYRHQATPCNYSTMLVDQNGSYMKNTQDFLDIVGRKYDNGASRTNKMKEETRLYMPVPHADIVTCRPWLRQNPGYQDED